MQEYRIFEKNKINYHSFIIIHLFLFIIVHLLLFIIIQLYIIIIITYYNKFYKFGICNPNARSSSFQNEEDHIYSTQ